MTTTPPERPGRRTRRLATATRLGAAEALTRDAVLRHVGTDPDINGRRELGRAASRAWVRTRRALRGEGWRG